MRDASGLALAVGMFALILGLAGVILPSSEEQESVWTYSQPSRALNTIYQASNNLEVHCVVNCYIQDGYAYAYAFAEIGSYSPPTTHLGFQGLETTETGFYSVYVDVNFLVPKDYYYRVSSTVLGSGTVDLIEWTEYILA